MKLNFSFRGLLTGVLFWPKNKGKQKQWLLQNMNRMHRFKCEKKYGILATLPLWICWLFRKKGCSTFPLNAYLKIEKAKEIFFIWILNRGFQRNAARLIIHIYSNVIKYYLKKSYVLKSNLWFDLFSNFNTKRMNIEHVLHHGHSVSN